MAASKSKNRTKKTFMPSKKAYYALSIFVIGAVHLIIARQVIIKPTSYELKLSLVRNEFLDKPPKKIVVVGTSGGGGGEIYSSGDDAHYAASVLRHAFGDDMTMSHDHIYRQDLLDRNEVMDVASRTDVLWIMVVRSPCAWADSLIRSRKESCQEEGNGGLPREQCTAYEFASETDYYRIPWYDHLRGDGGSSGAIATGRDNNITIIQSKPGQSSSYDDIFEMRLQKLLVMKQIMDAVPRHVKILRPGEFELNPDVFVRDLVKEYKFMTAKRYKPPPPKVDPESTSFDPGSIFSCMEYDKWKEAQTRIDWILEGYFGHNHLDCHLCRESGRSSTGLTRSSPPSNIYVLGERNSGTTFVSDTLAQAFDPPNMNEFMFAQEKFSSEIPVLLHKHMFRHDLLDANELAEVKARDDVLWILVVRSPCDWAEAMFRKPYHLCPPDKPNMCGPDSNPNKTIWMNQNTVAGVPLLHFLTDMKWEDWAESVPFWREAEGGGKKKARVSMSKVSANYTYPNVFGLRRHKLGIMKQIIETAPRNVKFVHLKQLERSPEVFIQSVIREFKMTVKDGYRPQPASKLAHTTTCLTPAEWDASQKNIDWNLEAEFGFSPFDCRMCYGYDKSTRLYTRIMRGKEVNKILKGDAIVKEKQGKTKKENKPTERKSNKVAKPDDQKKKKDWKE